MSKSSKKKPVKKISAPVKKIAPVPLPIRIIDEITIGKIKIPVAKLFWLSLLLMGIFLFAGAISTGVPGDEPIDYAYGKASLNYFATFGKDTTYSSLKLNESSFPDQKYYGAAFEMIAPLINKMTGLENPFPIHHILCALAGMVLLLYTGLIAWRLKGAAAGLLALWIIFLTPVITGNAFFNSKDIPFAAAFAAGFYYLLLFFEALPTLSRSALTGVAISAEVAVSIRVSGILLPCYIGLFIMGWYAVNRNQLRNNIFFRKYFVPVIIALLAGTIAGFITYPNFWHEGINHITHGLAATKKFQHNIFMLYDDALVSSQKIDTVAYLIKYLGMSVPELVLGGFILSSFLLLSYRRRFKMQYTWMLLFAALFPFAYVMLVKAPVYNGWRHLIFAYPFIVIITAVGLTELLHLIKLQSLGYTIGSIILLFLVDLTIWQLRAFPYNYIYYNHLSGGLTGIYRHYDTDYQQLSTNEGVKWLLKNETNLPKPLTILSNNANSLRYQYDSSQVKFNYVSIKDMWLTDWDYAVVSTVFLNKKVINAMFPPNGTVHIIERFNVPLTFVVKRRSRDDVMIYRMMIHDSLRYANALIDHTFRENKSNTMTIYWKACSLFIGGQYNESLQLVAQYDELFPNQDYVYELIGYDYYYLHEWEKAMNYIGAVYSKKPEKKNYAQIIGDCLSNLGRQQEAAAYYQRAK